MGSLKMALYCVLLIQHEERSMKNILIIGANGSLAREVVAAAERHPDLRLTLFARRPKNTAKTHRTFAGDALNVADLTAAMAGQDVVYVNLAGDLGAMGANIVAVMKAAGVRRVVAVSSIGIYDEPLRAVLRPYRALADIIEQSGLDYALVVLQRFQAAFAFSR